MSSENALTSNEWFIVLYEWQGAHDLSGCREWFAGSDMFGSEVTANESVDKLRRKIEPVNGQLRYRNVRGPFIWAEPSHHETGAGVKCTHCNGKGETESFYNQERGWQNDGPCATCNGTGRIRTVEQYLKTLAADWHQDSSLETWFPLTAQELARYKQALTRANGFLIMHGHEPVKLEYAQPSAEEPAAPELTSRQHAARNALRGCTCGSDCDVHQIYCEIGAPKATCIYRDGCAQPVYKSGLCKPHYLDAVWSSEKPRNCIHDGHPCNASDLCEECPLNGKGDGK